MELKRTDVSVRTERAVLVGVASPGEHASPGELLSELVGLARTAGAKVVEKVCQYNHKIDPSYYVGKGKAGQVARLSSQVGADVVICDDDLSPRQVRNLEQLISLKVIDRSEVIMDIFATHAETTQAKMQVELAQLEYAFPRLKSMWTHFSRIVGTGQGTPGIGVRGPGERQLEVDRRLVERRIHELRSRLKKIQARQESSVSSRNKRFLTAGLVGYTNAGKSSLMNALTDAGVPVAEKLFATLETRTRRLDLGQGRTILLSDTVGFIRKLPHHLVASFHATLEETREADLLLHVVDAVAADAMEQVQAVENVLSQLGCSGKPVLLVLNKMDKMKDFSILPLLGQKYAEICSVSALTGEGISDLRQALADFCDRYEVEVTVRYPAHDGKNAEFLRKRATVLAQRVEGDHVVVRVRMGRQYLDGLPHLGIEVSSVDQTGGQEQC